MTTKLTGAMPIGATAQPGRLGAARLAVLVLLQALTASVGHAETLLIEGDPYLLKRELAVGGGFYYHVPGDLAAPPPFEILRTPARGGLATTIERFPAEVTVWPSGLTADESGVYYVFDNRVFRIPPTGAASVEVFDPDTIAGVNLLVEPVRPTLDATSIYVRATELDGSREYIVRVAKDGSGGCILASAPSLSFTGAPVVVGLTIIWTDRAGLWAAPIDPPSCPGNRVLLTGDPLARHDDPLGASYKPMSELVYELGAVGGPLFWSKGNQIVGYDGVHPPTVLHTAIDPSPGEVGRWTIGAIGFGPDPHVLFFREARFGIPPPTKTFNGRIRSITLADRVAVDRALELPDTGFSLLQFDDIGAYYMGPYGIARLAYDEAPVMRDVQAEVWEITQGIQSEDNDVQLIAGKPTWVRLFARQLAGVPINRPQAYLHGVDGETGVPLPGSPLAPVNGPERLDPKKPYNRLNNADAWLFRLPLSWVRHVPNTLRSVVLRAVVEPRGMFNDPNLRNNELTLRRYLNKHFAICGLFVPVRTDAPRPRILELPGFGHMIDLFLRMTPYSDFWVYESTEDVAEYEFPFGFGYYEMSDDGTGVLNTLWLDNFLGDDPDECDDAGASTHRIGMVHPLSPMIGGDSGQGRLSSDVAWLRLDGTNSAPISAYPSAPASGVYLAHELGHNFGAKHVNCGVSEEVREEQGIDEGYYYDPCQLDQYDPPVPPTHYGFDTGSRYVLGPFNPFNSPATGDTSDIMSYGDQRWVSDYRWQFGFFNSPKFGFFNSPKLALRASELTAPAEMLVVGRLGAEASFARVLSTWPLPGDALSDRVREKWAAQRAAAYIPGIDAGAPHLRMVDTLGTVLGDWAIEPFRDQDLPASDGQGFGVVVPMPDGDTRELQLLRGTLVLDSVRAGSTAPEVSVLTPAGGEVVADALAVRWSTRERDRDDFVRLLIQYSPDLGRTWVPLVTDRPAAGGEETASFDVESLPGSQPGEAVVRVVATDGLHAGIDVSAPFTLLHHPPRVFITSPGAGQTIQAGAAVVLRGFAMDVEDGGRVADTLAWTLDGQPAGEGAEQLVAGLAPGMHRARLAAQDTQGSEGEATVDFRVAPLGVAAGDEPTLDGDCSDDAYGRAVTVGLRPYADGMQATVQILRTASALWTCFSGLDRGGGTPLATAGITVDGDASGGSVAGLADRAFLVAEDGSLRALVGDGIGGFTAGGPEALRARISATDEAWQAELRIDTAALGAAQPGVAIAFGHFAVRFLGDDYTWPSGADRDVPSTWGSTVLGDLPDEDCDDGDPCTQDRYQPDTGCRHDSVSGCCREDRDCGDTDTCDGATRCVEARCVSFPPVSCEDDDPCTSNVCVPEHGCTTIHTVDLDTLRCRLAAIEALLRAAPEDGFRGPPLRHLLLQHIVRLQRLVRSGHGPRVGLRLKALESRLRVFLKLAGRFIVDGPLARSVIRLGTEALAEMPALRSIYPSAGTPPGHAKP